MSCTNIRLERITVDIDVKKKHNKENIISSVVVKTTIDKSKVG